jgi:hypothetical protein
VNHLPQSEEFASRKRGEVRGSRFEQGIAGGATGKTDRQAGLQGFSQYEE